MKTLLKNRRTYRNRIGTLDDEYDTMKKEEDEEGDHNGNNNNDEGNNGKTIPTVRRRCTRPRRGNILAMRTTTTRMRVMKMRVGTVQAFVAARVVVVRTRMGTATIGSRGEGGGGDEDGNGGTVTNGSRGVSGRKNNEGRIRMKRKKQDDEPAARAKRMKKGSGGDQVATKSTKKAKPKKKSGKKSN
jgi:hypothetical protein